MINLAFPRPVNPFYLQETRIFFCVWQKSRIKKGNQTHSRRCSWCHLPLACPGKKERKDQYWARAWFVQVFQMDTICNHWEWKKGFKKKEGFGIDLNMRAGEITCVCAWRTISRKRENRAPSQSTRFRRRLFRRTCCSAMIQPSNCTTSRLWFITISATLQVQLKKRNNKNFGVGHKGQQKIFQI